MDIVKSGVSTVRSNSKVSRNVLLCLCLFFMLPIDRMLKVRVQSQVAQPLRQLLDNDVMRLLLIFVGYLIVLTNDAILLILYLCFLNKLGIN